MKEILIGMGFYTRDQWQRLVDTAEDAEVLEQTYDEWLNVFDRAMGRIRESGASPELVRVDVEELLRFCREKRLPNNGKTRSLFVSELVRHRYDEPDGPERTG